MLRDGLRSVKVDCFELIVVISGLVSNWKDELNSLVIELL